MVVLPAPVGPTKAKTCPFLAKNDAFLSCKSFRLLVYEKLTFLNSILVLISKIIFGAFEGFIYAGSKIPLLQIGVSQKFSILFVFSFYIILFILVFKIIPFFTFDKK